jgi:uncharacterized membrane protein YbaN (DUF454 family)
VSIVRWTRAALGLGCFGLAGIGAVVPGLPTTIFLLMGSYLLTRSCPVLERRIRENRLFRPYVAYLDPTVPLPRRARLAALTAMWASIGVSALLIYARQPSPAVPLLLVAAGFVATVVILRFRSHLGR